MRRHTKPIDKIVLHNTQTEVQDMDTAIDYIRYLHVERRGWAEIGYHYVIHPLTGEVRYTRSVEFMGAHAKGANDGSIGIAVIGDWRKERMPPAGAIRTHRLVCEISGFYGRNDRVFSDKPPEVYTHATCPGCTTNTDCGAEGSGVYELVEALRGA